jgi:cation diffusion facilitator CzcD-associated flavoprotein CzcO
MLSAALLHSPVGVRAVLPASAEAVVREFEGPTASRAIAEEVTAAAVRRSRLALSRHLGVADRVHAARAAVCALDAAAGASRDPAAARPALASTGVVIVGGGLTGVTLASALAAAGADLLILERASTIGGVWRWHGNPHSRVNSTEPAYRVARRREQPNTNHSYFCEIIDDLRRLIEEHDLAGRTWLNANVSRVFRAGGGAWQAVGESCGAASSLGRFTVSAAADGMLLLCTNRRLGAPRELKYDGEASFEGRVIRGLGGDNVGLPWAGKRVLVIGHGPFAIEQVRTALEHGAAHVTALVRRHGLVCPQVLDYLNLVRQITVYL